MRVGHLLVAVSMLACSSDEPGPLVDGFYCGGLAGEACPPESTCGDCDDPDCAMPCYATRPCTPDASDCPDPTTCDADSGYCMPAQTCSARAECGAGRFCVHQGFSGGVGFCADVAPVAPASCDRDDPCPFPWVCLGATNGTCRLYCLDGECPEGLRCEDNFCVE